MKCNVGRRLAEAFALAAREYAETGASLGLLTGRFDSTQMLRAEEETLRRASEALRKAEAARAALETHIDQHRCDDYAASQSGREELAG